MKRAFWRTALAVTGLFALTNCTEPVRETGEFTLIGAGDIGACGGESESTARIIESTPGTVFTLGDNAYPDGTAAQFQQCYDPTWGRFKDRTKPVPGNHDYRQPNGGPYFDYFGAAAGVAGKGWYSYEIGDWHVIALNSQASMEPGSEQDQWLLADIEKAPNKCVLAYWHEPRFSSGPHSNDATYNRFWSVLYTRGADVVVNGHDHLYERFAPQNIDAQPVADGMREFIVGTGGADLYPVEIVKANSEKRIDSSYGVLKLTLLPGSYRWDFIGVVAGKGQVLDSGEAACLNDR